MGRSRKLFEGGEVSLLTEILRGTTPLRDALCVEYPKAFDPPAPREAPASVAHRHRVAARICTGCPVLAACRAWADQHPADGMVVAGRIPTPAHPGRPPKMMKENGNAPIGRTA